MKTALLAGTTGLIGSQLLELLLQDNRYEKVVAISRRVLTKTHPKLQNIVADLNTIEQFRESFGANDVFCCLGTTMRQARTREAFRKVDFDYPVAIASIAKSLGARQFLLVSALGANKSSSIFYNRVKGETEEAILKIGFESYHVFRPSLLMGPRTEVRAGEQAAKWVYTYLGFLVPSKYKGIESIKVARAISNIAGKELTGNFVYESSVLQVY